MNEDEIITAVKICEIVIVLVFHSLGIYLLHEVKKDHFNEIHHLYLLQLAATSFVYCSINIINKVLLFYQIEQLALVFEALCNGFLFPCILGLSGLIVLDNFLLVYYSIRYNVIWSKRKTIIASCTVYIVFFIVTVVMLGATHSSHADFRTSLTIYLWPLLEFGFLIFVLSTFLYTAWKLKTNSRISTSATVEKTTKTSTKTPQRIFRRENTRRRRTHILLIANIIVLLIIPDQILFYYAFSQKEMPLSMDLLAHTFFSSSIAMIAVIYIFGPIKIRNLFLQKLRDAWCCFKRHIEDNQNN